MTDAFTLNAWVDESVHVTAGFYVLAAAVADPTSCDDHRKELQALARSPRRRFHWRHEDDHDRIGACRLIASMDLGHVVVVGSPIEARRQERGRRKCLERLLHELGTQTVGNVWLESRGDSLNQRDLTMVAALRSSGALPEGLHVDVARPFDEPMLWIPDAVAGAVAAAHKGATHWRHALGPITEIEIDP